MSMLNKFLCSVENRVNSAHPFGSMFNRETHFGLECEYGTDHYSVVLLYNDSIFNTDDRIWVIYGSLVYRITKEEYDTIKEFFDLKEPDDRIPLDDPRVRQLIDVMKI